MYGARGKGENTETRRDVMKDKGKKQKSKKFLRIKESVPGKY